MKYILTLLAALLVAGPAVAGTERTSRSPNVTLRSLDEYTTTASVTIINDAGYCGALLWWNATVDGASAIVTISVDLVDAIGGAVDTLFTFTETINAVEVKVMRIGTATAATGVVDEITLVPLPGIFTVNMTHTDTDAITYSANMSFVSVCPGAVQ